MTKTEQKRHIASAIQSMYAEEFISWCVEFKDIDNDTDYIQLQLNSKGFTVIAQINYDGFQPYNFIISKGNDPVELEYKANKIAIHSLTKLLSFNTSHLSAKDCCRLVDLPILASTDSTDSTDSADSTDSTGMWS